MEKPGNSIGNIVSDAFTSMDIVHLTFNPHVA